jgi:2-hydroxychromene-2-carboxylate isomerase
MAHLRVTHYFDYKSPYAYLAQEETFALAEQYAIELDVVPYTLDIPAYLGKAEVDDRGNVVSEERNAHQWRRVKYGYMDCRREAQRRGLTIRGPRKLMDSSIAHIGFLYAKAQGNLRPYHDAVWERFWKRELDIEDAAAIAALLDESGLNGADFAAYLAGPGRDELRRLQLEAEAQGVFGVPSYLVDGELYWGAERLERVRERIQAA